MGADAAWLAPRLAAAGAVAGSVHRREGDGLRLTGAVNLPEAVQAVVDFVPAGKGMAGLALSRQVPVVSCNIQTDETGDVKPGARAVDAQAAAALPVFDEVGAVRAVVGFAFAEDRALSEAELAALSAVAAELR
ncbi:MAG: GAF domain-containing protein [Myxococcales bacterium]|nr:GAF domain-containing protein [Myxococcales bacterium]MCB9525732.1 GAF domain-containing protein [Myxococcales bacterium]